MTMRTAPCWPSGATWRALCLAGSATSSPGSASSTAAGPCHWPKAPASAGDLIINRKNDHKAGLANGDIVRVEAIEDDGLVLIRKATGRDPATGEPVFASKTVTRRSLRQFDSAYASTVHSKPGRQADAPITVY